MSTLLRVLIVEDSEDDTLLLVRELRREGYLPTYLRVDTAAAFTTALATQEWDLIIADYTLPQFTGMAALKLLQEQAKDIPFLVVSGIINESLAVEAMKSGAQDYLMKDNLRRLAPAVDRELREAVVRRERLQTEAVLRATEAWVRHANALLLRLAKSAHLREGNLPLIFAELTEAAAHNLAVNRAAIWLLTDDGAQLVCHDSYEPDSGRHTIDTPCQVARLPLYVQSLEENLIIAASDVQQASQLCELSEDYRAKGVTSTLNAATRVQDKLAGVVCLEHSGAERQWRPEEEAFAASLADLVSLALSAHQQRQAEEALRRSEQKYRELFENANDMIYTLDSEGRFVTINKRGELYTGYSQGELAGMLGSKIIAPEYLALSEERQDFKYAKPSENTVYQLEIICKDGSRLPLEVNSRLIYENSRPIGIQGIARDISERKELEEQLSHAQKMEAVGRLAGAIAHDFNNVLTAILGYSQLLLRRMDANATERQGAHTASMRREVAEIEKAAQRAATLTNQLLAFSRKQVFRPQALNLNHVITDLQNILQRLLGENIEFVTRYDRKLGSVNADPGRLEQVIVNLAVNGRDAMPAGGRLTIETANIELDAAYTNRYPEVEAGSYVMMAVSDNGIGIEKLVQSRIFEPFFTTKEPGKGTGLGLSTVYGIVKQSGGHIEVHSEPGQGTTFRIYLPRIESQPQLIVAPKTQDTPTNGTETVLLAEDDTGVRQLVRHMLQLNGYTVLEAKNAQEALAYCQEYRGLISLVLADVVMPHISGPALVQKVVAMRPEIKVLYMSGYPDSPMIPDGVINGTMLFLEKPFSPETLTQTIRQVLDRD
jgi:PAS domain S-box-containing protein